MIEVIDGKLKRRSLPKSGKLKDGRTVSGYHNLPKEVLIAEGWLPLIDVEPEHDPATHEVIHGGYDIQVDKVIKLYKVVEIVEPGPTEIEMLQEELNTLKESMQIMLGVKTHEEPIE